jgi:hypothetical protein
VILLLEWLVLFVGFPPVAFLDLVPVSIFLIFAVPACDALLLTFFPPVRTSNSHISPMIQQWRWRRDEIKEDDRRFTGSEGLSCVSPLEGTPKR